MRPFGYSITILNTLDHLGKFDGKADKGFFVGYYTNSKEYMVFNSRIRIVEENLHVKFSEETPNIAGNGPNWLFDIDALTISMNYKPVVTGNKTNGNAGTKENIDAGLDGKKIVPDQKYILLPLLTSDLSLFKSSKDSLDAGFKPSGEEEKIDFKHQENEDSEVPNTKEPRVNQEQDANVNSTNNINTVSPTVSAANIENNIDADEVGAEADMNNLSTYVPVSPIPTTRVHKDHPLKQIIRDIHLAPQTRRMTKNVTDHGKRAIGTKWVYRNKKDDLGIVVRNKARLVAQGYTQEKGIDYDEVFAPVARIEAIRLFLAYASFMGLIVYQMDVKSTFLYGTIEEEVYVCQPPGFEDPQFPNKVYKKEDGIFISQDNYVADILKKFDFTTVKAASTPIETNKALNKDEEAEDVDFQVTPKFFFPHISVVRRIFRNLKGQPKLGLWCPRDSPFDLEAFSDSDYVGASLDRKSTIGGLIVFHSKTKHIEIRHHFIRDSYKKKLIQVIKIHKDHNVADLLSNAFDVSRKAKNTTEISQSSGPIPLITYETVIKEWEDRIEKAATTASSLVAEQDSVNGERQIQALVDKKKVIITETSIGSDLKLNDVDGTDCLPTATIFAELERMGLQEKVIDLEKAKTAQQRRICKLKERESMQIGNDKEVKNSRAQEIKKIDDLNADAEVTLVDETHEMNDDNLMFDTSVLEEHECHTPPRQKHEA
ncbi:ribonuclease H-like domain-containing protein [Tanacetum coccineum]